MNLTVGNDSPQVAPANVPRGANTGTAVTLPGGIVPTAYGDEQYTTPAQPMLAPRGASRRDTAPLVIGRDQPGPHLDGSHASPPGSDPGGAAGRDDSIAPEFLTVTPDPRPWTDDLPTIGG